ncbi:TPA: hypothetical protein L5T32_004201 [Pseudomonas aeruginosa]|nr:hypothetical protein [Pseudomonas aeruginosa]
MIQNQDFVQFKDAVCNNQESLRDALFNGGFDRYQTAVALIDAFRKHVQGNKIIINEEHPHETLDRLVKITTSQKPLKIPHHDDSEAIQRVLLVSDGFQINDNNNHLSMWGLEAKTHDGKFELYIDVYPKGWHTGYYYKDESGFSSMLFSDGSLIQGPDYQIKYNDDLRWSFEFTAMSTIVQLEQMIMHESPSSIQTKTFNNLIRLKNNFLVNFK